jgi:hypothetical protein
MKTYQVFRQAEPERVGPDWQSVLEPVGIVSAEGGEDAIEKAKALCPRPIVERMTIQ